MIRSARSKKLGQSVMRIGEAAQAADVGVETIRFYERKGLIEQPVKPISGGFRNYSRTTVESIGFIRQAQEIGFSLREIKELLSLRVDPDADCFEVREHAQVKLDEVNRKLASLTAVKAVLNKLIRSCPGEGALGGCSIMEALAANAAARKGRVGAAKESR